MDITLKLGSTDQGRKPSNLEAFFAPYHSELVSTLKQKKFRSEVNDEWIDFEEKPGTSVQELQETLQMLGLDPLRTDHIGIFGYGTRSAVRLFQEYVRTIDGNPEPALKVPAGVAKGKTLQHLARWKTQSQQGKKLEWNAGKPSVDYQDWLNMLENMRKFYQNPQNSGPLLHKILQFKRPTDTLQPVDWNVSPDAVHLIGIRGNAKAAATNNDLLILLVNGMVFKFWGSTRPSPAKGKRRKDIPFLLEGQHKYNFGWHNLSPREGKDILYPALRPSANKGVLVVRDENYDALMTDEELAKNDLETVTDINIHWSGEGRSNWSAGCQVIAGRSYINNKKQEISCASYAAGSYEQLSDIQTRGAYNVLTDLILTFAPAGTKNVYYTLINEERVKIFNPNLNVVAIVEALQSPTRTDLIA